jgi:hypothetical protein
MSSVLSTRHKATNRLVARITVLCPGGQDDGSFNMDPSNSTLSVLV